MILRRLLLLSSTLYTARSQNVAPYGFQSGVDMGPSYAGGMAYDSEYNLLFLTGQTYGEYFLGDLLGIQRNPVQSNCFVTVMKLPTETNSEFKLLYTQEFGNASVPEACNSVVYSNKRLFVMGHSEEHGELVKMRVFGSKKSLVYGMVADFDVNLGVESGVVKDAALELKGGMILHPTKGVHYPMALAHEDVEGSLFMASIRSENPAPVDAAQDPAMVDAAKEIVEKPDLTKGGLKKYGVDYSVIIERLETWDSAPPNPNTNLNVTLKAKWTWEGDARREADAADEDVFLTDLEYINEGVLLFAGYTKGFGPAFGNSLKSGNDDYDGFVTKMNAARGDVQAGTKLSARIGSDRDDKIHALCHTQDHVYVVGSTKGMLLQDDNDNESGSDAFLMQLDLETLDKVWVRQISAVPGPHSPVGSEPNVVGVACAVSGNRVYFAGNVENGAILNGTDIPGAYSLGGSDVFVVQLNAADGSMNWAVQTGTSKDERIAHGGGLVTDKQGNVILMGNSNGSMLRQKKVDVDPHTNVFFQSFAANTGEHKPSVDEVHGLHEVVPHANPNPIPTVPAATPAPGSETTPEAPSPGPTEKPQVPAAATSESSSDGDKMSGGLIFLIVVLSLLGCAILCCAVRALRRRLPGSKHTIQEDPVSPYIINRLDSADVDVKRSSNGGTHGIYSGSSSSRTSHSSYEEELEEIKFNVGAPSAFDQSFVQNSLFMDDMDVPSLGNNSSRSNRSAPLMSTAEEDQEGDEMFTRQLSTYDDLLDAYNTTWDDLNPHKLPTDSSGLSNMRASSRRRRDMESAGLLDEQGWGTDII